MPIIFSVVNGSVDLACWVADQDRPHADWPGDEHEEDWEAWDEERCQLHSYFGRPPATHDFGVRSSPSLWGVQGGKGTSNLEVARDRTHSKQPDDNQ
jgi:hypothetical protein